MSPSLTETVLSLSNSPDLALLAKATVLIAMGLVAAQLAVRARASVRHLLLATTLAALLALPIVVSSAPDVAIGVPIARSASEVTPIVGPGRAAVAPRGAPTATAQPADAKSSLFWAAVIRAAWIAGTALFLTQLVLMLWRFRRVRRTSLPWTEMRDAGRSLATDAGIARPVDIVLHEEAPSPFTFGTRRPVIVFPPDARTWNEADLRRALVHELAHVKRRDWALLTGARIACAIWWFHPLVWIGWRRLGLEAERACDDAVIVKEGSMDYAEQLISMAERLGAARAQTTLGMANRSDLSVRVSSLLDPGRRRGRAGMGAVAGVIAAACIAVSAVAPLRAVASPADSPTASADQERRSLRGLNQELYEAAREADLTGIRDLLQSGADVNASIAGDGSPLIGAVRSRRVNAVSLLLDRGADPNLGVKGDGSPLIVAAESPAVDIVRLLLDRGADPNMGVAGDGSPLIAAAASGRVEIVSLLLDRGADVNMVVPGDENPLIQAAAEGHLAVAQALVARGADVNVRVWAEGNRSRDEGREGEWRTPLGMALKGNHADVVAYLRSVNARE